MATVDAVYASTQMDQKEDGNDTASLSSHGDAAALAEAPKKSKKMPPGITGAARRPKRHVWNSAQGDVQSQAARLGRRTVARFAHRAGAGRMDRSCTPAIQAVVAAVAQDVMRVALIYAQHERRNTVMLRDVRRATEYAFRMPLYI